MDKKSLLETFLGVLSDHELAIYTGYNFDGLMQGSKDKVTHEIQKRGLNREQLESFFQQKLDKKTEEDILTCPRCGSDYLYKESDVEHRQYGNYSAVDVEIDTLRCRLCGYNPEKELPKNIFERIGRIFRSNRRERIIKRYN